MPSVRAGQLIASLNGLLFALHGPLGVRGGLPFALQRGRGIGDGGAPLRPGGDQTDEGDEHQRGRQSRDRRAAPAPHPGASGRRNRPGGNGLAIEPSVQVIRQFSGCRVPPPRLLFQAFQTDHFQVARDLAVEPRRGLGRFLPHGLQGVDNAVAFERRLACQQRIEDRTQAVDIGRRRDRAAAAQRLLRGHVGRGSHDRAGLGQLDALVEPLGQAEIRDVRLALLVQQDVRGFEVAVQDSPHMGVLDRFGDVGQQGRDGPRVVPVGVQPSRPGCRPESASC